MSSTKAGFFSRIFSPREAKSSSSLDLFRELFGGTPSRSGQTVNYKTALEVTTALACVRVLAEGVAQVPWKVFEKQPDGGRREAVNHWAYKLLTQRPNPWQNTFTFREQLMLHLALCGNAFVWKNKASDNRVIELLPLEPGRVSVERQKDYSLKYTVTLPGDERRVIMPAGSIWHIQGLSWDGVLGLESVRLLREAIGLGMAAEGVEANGFRNGTRLAGVLEYPGTLKDEGLKRLRESWEANYSGTGNSGKTAILENGMKFNANSQTHEDAQLLELRGFQVEEICRGFRVLPIMVGRADKTATYASAEQMFLAHVIHTLCPWFARIEAAADADLIGGDGSVYTKFLPAGLLRGDATSRAAFYKELFSIGALSPNDIRSFEELNPVPGGAGYFIPSSVVPPSQATLNGTMGAA